MNRSISRVVVASLILSAVSLFAPAGISEDAKGLAQEIPSKKKVTRFPFRGKIHAVDKKAMTITLDGKVKKRTIHLVAQTKIVKTGKPASLDDAVIGEQVGGLLARYSDGREEVISIRFGPKPDTTTGDPKAKRASTPAEGEEQD